MDTMIGQDGSAPYAPAKAVLLAVDTYRDRTLPLPVTTTVLERAGIEASLCRRTLAALKQLDLLDEDGNPTDTMRAIKTVSSDELPGVLASWLRAAYAPILQYVDPHESVTRITDQFRHYEPSGMRNRMVTLFLGLCVRAGMIDVMPTMPRSKEGAAGGAVKSVKATKGTARRQENATATGTDQAKPAADDSQAAADGRQRYIDLLISLASKSDSPDPVLLDRIERALGIEASP